MKTKIQNKKLALSKEALVTLSNLKLKTIIGGTGGADSCRCSRFAEEDGDCGAPKPPRTGFDGQ